MFVGTFATIAWEVMGHPFGLAARCCHTSMEVVL